jgi:hypothetical protein
MELLQERAGIKLQMITYTGGPTAAMADVGTGRVAIVIEGYSGLAGGLTGGLIKGIAVSSYERLADFKDLATVAGAARLHRRRLNCAAGAGQHAWGVTARRAEICARRSTMPSSRPSSRARRPASDDASR